MPLPGQATPKPRPSHAKLRPSILQALMKGFTQFRLIAQNRGLKIVTVLKVVMVGLRNAQHTKCDCRFSTWSHRLQVLVKQLFQVGAKMGRAVPLRGDPFAPGATPFAPLFAHGAATLPLG